VIWEKQGGKCGDTTGRSCGTLFEGESVGTPETNNEPSVLISIKKVGF
jgi:hypothetical protein